MPAPLGILGAGASGLSLALLTHLDHVVLELLQQPGGHARATSIDGFVFDQGPHIMFSRDALLLDCMVASLGDNVHQSRRNNKVAIAGALARYPMENDLAALPLPLRADALLSFLHAREEHGQPANLAEWFTQNFGAVLTSAYFRPYNEKLWKTPLEHLSMSWAERIPWPPVDDVVRGALGELSEGYLHQLYYSYPLTGGYGALMDAWASGVSSDAIAYGTRVTAVRPTAAGVRVESPDAVWDFEQVVSTVPLRLLTTLVPDVPAHVVTAVERLIVNPIVIATLGFRGTDPNQFTAVYIPDDDYLVNRVSFPAVFSPRNAPEGCFSVQAEITAAPGADVLNMRDSDVVEHVLAGLRGRRLVPADAELVFQHVEHFDDGYVVYTENYEDDLQTAVSWFEERRIIPHGRFGRHNYLNVDGCLAESIALARRLGADLSDDAIRERFHTLPQLEPVAS